MRKYRIEPVYHNFPKEDMYYQIVRTSDKAILGAGSSLELLISLARTELQLGSYIDLEIV